MTVIAWDGKTIAADRHWQSGEEKFHVVPKLIKHGDWIIGGAGELTSVQAFIQWFTSKKQCADDYPLDRDSDSDIFEFDALCINIKTQEVREYTNLSVIPTVVTDTDYYAIGSGRMVALAVMSLGHSAKIAVDVCNKVCVACGGGVTHYDLTTGNLRVYNMPVISTNQQEMRSKHSSKRVRLVQQTEMKESA